MTDAEREQVRKLKEEVNREFFMTDEEREIELEAIKQKISEKIKEEDSQLVVLGSIMLSRKQPERMMQLKRINDARMSYNDPRYKEIFEEFDQRIDEVEELIYTNKKVWDIAFALGAKREIDVALWMRGTIYIDRIRLAYILSADYKMDMSTQVLQDGINDKTLQIQYAGLIRELSLAYSRQAGFLNQGKFGKKPDIMISDKPVQNVTHEQMEQIISEFRIMKLQEANFTPFVMVQPEHINVVQPQQFSNEDEIDRIIREGIADVDDTFSLDSIK